MAGRSARFGLPALLIALLTVFLCAHVEVEAKNKQVKRSTWFASASSSSPAQPDEVAEKDEFEDLPEGPVAPGSPTGPLVTKAKQGNGNKEGHEEAEEEDEFEKAPVAAERAGSNGAEKGGGSPAAAGQGTPPPPEKTYTFEAAALTVILLYGVVYLYGRRENEKVKDAWVKQFCDLFAAQFVEIGPAEITGSGSVSKTELMYKDSESTFVMYATGRRHVKSCLVTLQLRKRHDVFWTSVDYLYPTDDCVTIEVVLNAEDVDPFVLAVVRKKDLRHTVSQTSDLRDFTGESKFSELPKSFVTLTDCPSVVSDVLTPPVVKTLLKYESLFQLIHVTDQNTDHIFGSEGTPKTVARFRFSLPPPEQMAELTKLLEMSLFLIDHIATNVKLNQQAKTKAQNIRREIEQKRFRKMHEQRQELLQRKKAEKLERERQEYDQLTYEQKLKRDAKEERKRAKGGSGRMYRMKMAKG